VLARNASGVLTQNYHPASLTDPGYAKLEGTQLSFSDWDGGSAASGGGFAVATHSLKFSNGIATNDPSVIATTSRIDVNYLFNALRAPYTIGLRAEASDTDGIVGSSATQGPIAFRMGRLLLENAYGPELLPLIIPLRSEYFDGTRWRRNSFDSCSSYSMAQGTRDQWTGTLSDSETEFDRPLSSTTLVAGVASIAQPLRIEAPGTGEHGSLRIRYSLPSWLQFDWDGDGSHDDAPTATATFGRYRGSDRVIYWRERLPVIP
jgi:MSHA biogenesis protein MshQ